MRPNREHEWSAIHGFFTTLTLSSFGFPLVASIQQSMDDLLVKEQRTAKRSVDNDSKTDACHLGRPLGIAMEPECWLAALFFACGLEYGYK
jgi:hypothetical protein